MININLRPALEERFGKSKVQKVFGDAIIPCARIVTVSYKSVNFKKWLINETPFIDFVDEKRLENFLYSIEEFYKKRSKGGYHALEMQIANNVNGNIGYIILGTRAKSVKEYIKDSQDYQKLMESKNK